MTKKKLSCLFLTLLLLMVPATGCQYWDNWTNSGSGSGSSSGSVSSSSTQTEQPHGQVTVNLMERTPFNGRDLDPAFWSQMEAFCKAGPTHLILADLNAAPNQMTRAGFPGFWKAQLYGLATTYAGMNWSPSVVDLRDLYQQRGEINAWWSRYVGAIVQLMQKAPQTTALIIVNDGPDRVGFRLGPAMQRQMGSVAGRVQLGSTVHESQY
jgi:hypothetical protein